jgi:hypothetical protein
VKEWLLENNIDVKWSSKRLEYIRAVAPISTWEKLFQTKFFQWEYSDKYHNEKSIHTRSEDYHLPQHLIPHVQTVFRTCQAFPRIRKHVHRKTNQNQFKTIIHAKELQNVLRNQMKSQSTSKVTVSYLSNYYDIPVTSGSSQLNQSVFETASEYFSQNDLETFQDYYDLTIQAAIDYGGYETSSCTTGSTGKSCYEGNLDIQYLMGVAQQTSSIYWYVGGDDPFVDYVTEVSGTESYL